MVEVGGEMQTKNEIRRKVHFQRILKLDYNVIFITLDQSHSCDSHCQPMAGGLKQSRVISVANLYKNDA